MLGTACCACSAAQYEHHLLCLHCCSCRLELLAGMAAACCMHSLMWRSLMQSCLIQHRCHLLHLCHCSHRLRLLTHLVVACHVHGLMQRHLVLTALRPACVCAMPAAAALSNVRSTRLSSQPRSCPPSL